MRKIATKAQTRMILSLQNSAFKRIGERGWPTMFELSNASCPNPLKFYPFVSFSGPLNFFQVFYNFDQLLSILIADLMFLELRDLTAY